MIRLDALSLRVGGSGVQTYARELLRALPATWPAARFSATIERSLAAGLPEGVAADPVALPVDNGLVRKAVATTRSGPACDVLHGLDTDLPVRRPHGAATVVTVHDLALFDAPWAFGRATAVGKRALVAGAIRRADAVLAVSAFTAERVRARFGRDATVVHEAAGADFAPPSPEQVDAVRQRYALAERFVLHVGNLEPRKDTTTLAAAARAAGLPLVLAGGAVRRGATPAGVHELGYVDAVDLPALYAAASVVGYVARYEGFGLPPVEAMACGAVVMATPVGALPEVGGEGIEFVGIGDVEDQAAALRRLSADADLAAHRRAAGLAAAGRLSWGATAVGHAQLYRALVG